MNVIVTKDYKDSCKIVAGLIEEQVKKDSKSKLGLATGGTAEKVYPYLVDAYRQGRVSFKDVKTVNLDEYVGLSPDNPQSYRNYMDNLFFNHIDIDKKNTYVPSGTNNMKEEIQLFNEKLAEDRPIDIQLLGVGVSGHIGFNEPGEHLIAGVHIEPLSEKTIVSNSRFFAKKEDVPKNAITMGVGDILKAGKIVLIATGDNKAEAIRAVVTNDEVTTRVPATLLKLHRDATVVIDQELARKAGYIK